MNKRRHEDQTESLYRLSLAVGTTLDPARETEAFMGWLKQTIKPALAVLFLVDEKKKRLRVSASTAHISRKDPWLPMGFDPWRWLEEDGNIPSNAKYRHRYAVPISIEGELLGSLCVLSRKEGPRLENEKRLVKTAASYLAPVLRNVWRFLSLEKKVEERTRRLKKTLEKLEAEVTKRREAEQQIRRLIRFQQGVIEQANIWIDVMDREGNIIIWNRAAELISGYDRDEVVGHGRIWQWLYPDEHIREKILSKVKAVVEKEGMVEDFETTIRTKDGQQRIISWHARNITDDSGSPIGSMAIGRDVTEQKQLQRELLQSQKMEAIGRLAGAIAHDFNNLLTVINGYSDLILMALKEDEPFYKEIKEIRGAGKRAESLVRQLLAFSRRQLLQPKPVDLNSIIHETEKMLRRIIGEDVELVIKLAPGPLMAEVDPAQMEQVIVNLAVNARDAMPQGGTLTLETRSVFLDSSYAAAHGMDLSPGAYVMMAVTDTGTGMDPETQAHIFEPFFTTKGRDKGTGLGLSTVYGIVKQSNGFIWVYSEPGVGTTFKVYLPHIEDTALGSGKPRSARKPPRGSETILVVEDDDTVRDLTAMFIKGLGYRVLEAASSQDAIELSGNYKGRIDLLLTDVVMPQMGGPQLAEKLIRKRPDMKVLYMSGYTDDAVFRYGLIKGEARYIEKPFSPEKLAEELRKVIDAP